MAARLRPQELRVWLTMGKVLHDLGDFPKAIQAYEKALGLNPDDSEALIGFIGCLMNTDQPDQAEPALAKAIGKYPDDPRVLGFAVRGAFDANRLPEAIALADRAGVPPNPKNHDALLTRRPGPGGPGAVAASLARCRTGPGRLPQRPGLAAVAPEDPVQDGLDRACGHDSGRASAGTGSYHTDEPTKQGDHSSSRGSQTALDDGRDCSGGRILLACQPMLRGGGRRVDPNFHQARESLTALQAAQPDVARSPGRSTLFLPETGSSPSAASSP